MSDGWLGAGNAIERIHFVGVGGIGMSGIAKILAASGFSVSGSDLSPGPMLEELERMGVKTWVGHAAEHVGDAQAVVYSSAVDASNPELAQARRSGAALVHRSQMLAELMRFRTGIAISGTHGKTTTTAMTAMAFVEAGADPTVVVGARVGELGGNARLGRGSFFVAEADESDRSFLRLPSLCSVATNVDLDHMDEYRDEGDLAEAFVEFLGRVPFQGRAVACLDDPRLASLLHRVGRPVFTYGTAPEANLVAEQIRLEGRRTRFGCRLGGRALGEVELGVAGRHNVLNALAAIAAGLWAGLAFEDMARGLAKFRGAERRLQWKGEAGGVAVIDDYAHHPAEIQAALAAAALLERPMIAVYQPHRYSRTAHLRGKMGDCFKLASRVLLMDVYPAGESPIPGVGSRDLATEIQACRPTLHVPDRERLLQILKTETTPGDLILTMGAGDVWRIGERFLEEHNS